MLSPTQGIESEVPLAFAALHRLLRPILPYASRLPAHQRAALEAALGDDVGPGADRFVVFVASLSLLAEAAEDTPLLCTIDDAHWLDDASAAALLFVARRLQAERIALLFAAREGDVRVLEAEGLPSLDLKGIGPEAAGELLAEVTGEPGVVRGADRSWSTPAATRWCWSSCRPCCPPAAGRQTSAAQRASTHPTSRAGVPRPQPPSSTGGTDTAAGRGCGRLAALVHDPRRRDRPGVRPGGRRRSRRFRAAARTGLGHLVAPPVGPFGGVPGRRAGTASRPIARWPTYWSRPTMPIGGVAPGRGLTHRTTSSRTRWRQQVPARWSAAGTRPHRRHSDQWRSSRPRPGKMPRRARPPLPTHGSPARVRGRGT